jgi:hypothetical protein
VGFDVLQEARLDPRFPLFGNLRDLLLDVLPDCVVDKRWRSHSLGVPYFGVDEKLQHIWDPIVGNNMAQHAENVIEMIPGGILRVHNPEPCMEKLGLVTGIHGVDGVDGDF